MATEEYLNEVLKTTIQEPTTGEYFTFQTSVGIDPSIDRLTMSGRELILSYLRVLYWKRNDPAAVGKGSKEKAAFALRVSEAAWAIPILHSLLSEVNITEVGDEIALSCVLSDSFPMSQSHVEGAEHERILDQEDIKRYKEFFQRTVDTAFRLQVVQVAMRYYWELHHPDPNKKKKGQTDNQLTLFSNSKELDLSNEFAMPKFLVDNLNRAIKDVTIEKGIQQYQKADPRHRGGLKQPAYKIKNQGDTETEFIYDAERVAIQTAEEFTKQLNRIKDAKVLQTLFALWKWTSLKDTQTFHDIPISEIMPLVLKQAGECKYNTAQRRDFSEVLEYLASMTITESIIGERVNKKTGKTRPELREEKGVRIFRMEATYSVKKEFQNLPKSELNRDLHFDKSVITRFSGEFLPDRPYLFATRAAIYFDSLLHLDANKDSKAIVMGFNIQTRFNQMQNKSDSIEVDRNYLINLCDYQKTNETKPSQATKQLANNFEKLIHAGLISAYDGLTNSNNDRVKIYPPQKPISSPKPAKA